MTPACTAHDPRLFDSTDWPDHVLARRVCGRCPVVAWCVGQALSIAREHTRGAVETRGPDGTWGGVLWRDGSIVTKRPAAECGTERGYQAHRYRKESACHDCLLAHRINERERLKTRREVA